MSDERAPRLKLGVDIGGTFTDLVLVDEANDHIYVGKELTTPSDPSQAVLRGLKQLLARYDLPVAALGQVVHATTLVTNAIIERKGAATGLVTTEGFRDVLEIAREVKYEVYDMFLPLPAPLVPRHLRTEVPERVTADGDVLVPLDEARLLETVAGLVDSGVESVAICFLHAYRNPVHEEQAAQLVQGQFPDLSVSISCQIAPEIREYERMNTTVANAYVQPLMHRYLNRLTDGLADAGFTKEFYMMLSSGGLTSVKDALAAPIRLLESGPAAGALLASYHADLGGHERVLAFDMGGTTAKMCLIDDAKPQVTHLFEAAREKRFKRGSGLPIRVTSVELIEIGAGGGSIARLDELGLVKVGPDSASSDPGPACYGRGGTLPTVTDANLVLGYYNPEAFLGGEFQLDLEAARRAVGTLADRLGVSVAEAAWGIHNIINEQMASAARIHVAEKGRDARQYTMLATGGGGPCHAAGIAAKLQASRIVLPPLAGVASAFGLLVAPPRVDLAQTAPQPLAAYDAAAVAALYARMEEQARLTLAEAGVAANAVTFVRTAEMRYVGQGAEIEVTLPDLSLAQLAELPAETLQTEFESQYKLLFSRAVPDAPVEAVTWRLAAFGPPPAVDFTAALARRSGTMQGEARIGTRQAYFPHWGEYRDVPVYNRYALGPGSGGSGPAIIEERESTAIVPPDASWHVNDYGVLTIELEGTTA